MVMDRQGILVVTLILTGMTSEDRRSKGPIFMARTIFWRSFVEGASFIPVQEAMKEN